MCYLVTREDITLQGIHISINILLQGMHVLDTRILYMYRVHEQLYFILYVHA